MPFSWATASSIRCPLVHDPGSQRARDDVSIPQLRHLAVGIPFPTSLFHALAQVQFGKIDTHRYRHVIGETRGGRVPVVLGDDEFHGLEPFPALRINRASAIASRRSVFTRSPGFRGISDGATTWQANPFRVRYRYSQ